MDETLPTTPSRARTFFQWLGSAALVYVIVYAGSAAQAHVPLFETTNHLTVMFIDLVWSALEPIIARMK